MLIRPAHQKCEIFYYWYFLDKEFKFQSDLSNGFHDVLMISMNLMIVINLWNYKFTAKCWFIYKKGPL